MENPYIISLENTHPTNQLFGFLKSISDYFLNEWENRLRQVLEEQSFSKSGNEQDSYITIGEVCKMLKKTRPTLNNWKKNGILIPDKYLGRSPMYLKSKILTLKANSND